MSQPRALSWVVLSVIRKMRGCEDILDDTTCSGGGADFGSTAVSSGWAVLKIVLSLHK
jgi:hypothetical protein